MPRTILCARRNQSWLRTRTKVNLSIRIESLFWNIVSQTKALELPVHSMAFRFARPVLWGNITVSS